MPALWWLVSAALVVLSSVLLVAGLQGKEGVLWIGKASQPETEEAPDAPPRPVHAANVAVGVVGIVVGIAAVVLFAA